MTTTLRIPPERDLPPGRLAQRQKHLMQELARAIGTEEAGHAPNVRRRRWMAVAATAAAGLIAIAVPALIPAGHTGSADKAAAAVLVRASRVAATQPGVSPPGPGQYVYTKTQAVWESTWADVGPTHDQAFSVLMPVTREAWIGPDGSGRLLETDGTPTFLTGRDHQVWVEAGSPDLGGNSTHDESFSAAAPDTGGLSYMDLSNLPTDPNRLRTLIEQRKVEGGPPGGAETFTIIGDMLRETYAPPELRAALFRIVSDLPGVQSIGEVTDPVGRAGVAVGYPGNGALHELVFDPQTSALLAEQTVITDPNQAHLDVPADTIVGWAASLASGIVDSTNQRP